MRSTVMPHNSADLRSMLEMMRLACLETEINVDVRWSVSIIEFDDDDDVVDFDVVVVVVI